jgi:hypothetical protein
VNKAFRAALHTLRASSEDVVASSRGVECSRMVLSDSHSLALI